MPDEPADRAGFQRASSQAPLLPPPPPLPGWYPDPSGRHEHRWWTGTQWGPDGGGTLFTEFVLLAGGKVRLEGGTGYGIRDQRGRQVAAVRRVRKRGLRMLIHLVAFDPGVTRRRQVVDARGHVVLALTRPRAWRRPRIIVRTGEGQEVGRILQRSLVRSSGVALESGGHQWGEIEPESGAIATYHVRDHTGVQVARIDRLRIRRSEHWYTSGRVDVLQLHRSLEEPLRTLVLSSALALDLVVIEGRFQPYRRTVLPPASS